MKPLKENICSDPMSSFRVSYSKIPLLDSPWHYHKEYELFYIIESTGTRFVGDHITNFAKGDMVFMGPDLPHVWKNTDEYYKNNSDLFAEAICVQFSENSFGNGFFNIQEMNHVKKLFNNSLRGLKINGNTFIRVEELLWKLLKSNSLKRFQYLIDILDILALSNELTPLASVQYSYNYYHPAQDKMDKVFDYISKNFKNEINLDEAAFYAQMSKTAFCRFFKKTTLKTFVEFVNQMKINYACKQLLNTELNIAEIGYDTGFKNPSYFIKTFKKITGLTPADYKQNFFKTLNQ